jgi:hypothetical protein
MVLVNTEFPSKQKIITFETIAFELFATDNMRVLNFQSGLI